MTDIDNQTLRESVAKSETGNALHDELDKLAREIAQQFSGQAQGPTYRVARLALEAGEQRGMKHQRERDAVIARKYRDEAGGSESYRQACEHIENAIRTQP